MQANKLSEINCFFQEFLSWYVNVFSKWIISFVCCLPYCNNHNFMVKLCQLEEKVCFWNKLLTYYPYPLYDTLMALPPAKLGVSLFRHPCRKPLSRVKGCVCFVGSASFRAFVHTRPASVPGENTGTGVPAQARMLVVSHPQSLHDATTQTGWQPATWGYAPNPIFNNDRGLSTIWHNFMVKLCTEKLHGG